MDTILLVAAVIFGAIQALSGLLGLSTRIHFGWLAFTLFVLTFVI